MVPCHSLCKVDCQCDSREVIVRIQLNHGRGEGREGEGKAKLCPGLPFPLRAKFQTHLMISNFFFFFL